MVRFPCVETRLRWRTSALLPGLLITHGRKNFPDLRAEITPLFTYFNRLETVSRRTGLIMRYRASAGEARLRITDKGLP